MEDEDNMGGVKGREEMNIGEIMRRGRMEEDWRKGIGKDENR
jgi:hypothetical protein